jgi:ABC-type spermidine/putrescine transport system permease subunit I
MLDPQLSSLLSELGVDPATVEALATGAIYLTIVCVAAAIPTGIIARRKGRSVSGWVIFALCVPLLPWAIVWLLPSRKDK